MHDDRWVILVEPFGRVDVLQSCAIKLKYRAIGHMPLHNPKKLHLIAGWRVDGHERGGLLGCRCCFSFLGPLASTQTKTHNGPAAGT